MQVMKIQTLAILMAFFLAVKPAHAQKLNLMQEAQMQRLITALEIKDYSKSYEIIQSLRKEGVEIKGELLYYEALSALADMRYGAATLQSEAYIKESGRKGKFYAAALEIYATAAERWDTDNLTNSFLNFNNESLSRLINFRFSKSNEDLFQEQKSRYDIWNNNYVNNKNGIISTFSVNRKNDGTYNLIRLDWLACPIGTTYLRLSGCAGEPQMIRHRDASNFVRAFSFLEFNDWRLPHQLHLDFDRSHAQIHREMSINSLRYGNKDAAGRTWYINQSNVLPHFHIMPGANNFMYYAPMHFREHHKIPCSSSSSTLYCEPGMTSKIIPVRGPYIVKQSSKVNCFETDLASRGKIGSYKLRQLRPSKTLCEFDDEKGKLYFLNNFYGANTFDPSLKQTVTPESEKTAAHQTTVKKTDEAQVALEAITGQSVPISESPESNESPESTSLTPEKTDKAQVAPESEMELRDVVLYREARMLNSGPSYRVSWQGKLLGVLRNGSVLRARLPPGSHTLTIGYVADNFEQPVTIADQGETYLFFRMKFSFSDSPRSHMTIESVSPPEGRAAVATLAQ